MENLHKDPNVFIENILSCVASFTKAHWSFHESEAMASLFINFTEKISEPIFCACYAHCLFIGVLPEDGYSLVSKTLF